MNNPDPPMSELRRLLLKCGVLLAAAPAVARSASPSGALESSNRGRPMVQDFPIPYRLFSAAMAWPVAPAPGTGFAAIVGERRGGETATFAMAYSAPGREARGFPWLRSREAEVAPGNAVLAASAQGSVAVIDMSGALRVMRDGREGRGPMLSPAVSLPAAPALPLDASAREWVVLTRDFRPHGESRNTLALFSPEKGLGAGFPALLSGIPETQSPALDAAGRRAYVALRTGQVDAISLADGTRPRGYPTAAVESPRPPGGFRLACSADGRFLYLATGSELLRIEAASGKTAPVRTAPGRRWAGVLADGAHVVAFDAASGRVVRLDAAGQETTSAAVKFGAVGAAPFMAVRGTDVALVGARGKDPTGRIEELFAQHAPQSEKARLEELALEEAHVRFRATKLTAAQQEAAKEDLVGLKRGWLERTLGLGRVEEMLRVEPATQVQVVRGLGSGTPAVVVDDLVAGFTPETGFSQCEHVLPVFWTDPRNGAAVLFVGLNAEPSGGKGAAFRALVRSYALPPSA